MLNDSDIKPENSSTKKANTDGDKYWHIVDPML